MTRPPSPLAPGALSLWGPQLRSWCLAELRRTGPLPLRELHARIHLGATRLPPAPVKALADAEDFEAEHGRLVRLSRRVSGPAGGAGGHGQSWPGPMSLPGPRTPPPMSLPTGWSARPTSACPPCQSNDSEAQRAAREARRRRSLRRARRRSRPTPTAQASTARMGGWFHRCAAWCVR